jgi:hypothetical protein
VIEDNEYGEPIYYLDEWLQSIGSERSTHRRPTRQRRAARTILRVFSNFFSKAQGKLQSAENLLRAKSEERGRVEDDVRAKLDAVFRHESLAGFPASRNRSTRRKSEGWPRSARIQERARAR